MDLAAAELEAIERDAYADFWAAAPAVLRDRHGIAHRRVGDGVLLRASGLAGSMVFNRLLGYGVTEPARGRCWTALSPSSGGPGSRPG